MLRLALEGIIILFLIREETRQRLNLDFSPHNRSIGHGDDEHFLSLSSTHLYAYSFDYTIEVFFLSILISYAKLPASDDLYDVNPSQEKIRRKEVTIHPLVC